MRSQRCHRAIILSTILFFILSITCNHVSIANEKVQTRTNSIKKLRVSLFPYVPSPKAIEETVKNHWNQKHPGIELEFDNPKTRWDCYSQDPMPDLDIFEFDAIFLEYFVRNNFISPINRDDIENVDDLMQFALSGSMVNGILYGIPRLACTPVLFYRKGDVALEKARSLQDIFKVIGARTDNEIRPPKNNGLLIDLSGGTTCACYYLTTFEELYKKYSVMPKLPSKENLDKRTIANLKLLTRMAGQAQAIFKDKEDQRANWFSQGYGRAFVAVSESLSAIPPEQHQKIVIRSLPLSIENPFNLFFIDLLAINPLLQGEHRKLAIEFVNLVTSKDVILECLLVQRDKTNSPQYLFPVRKSVISDRLLLVRAPLYKYLFELISHDPRAFRIGEGSKDWLETTKKAIQMEVTGIK